ncbi:MAG: SH3 domain-containing protein [Terriglobia bacterium]
MKKIALFVVIIAGGVACYYSIYVPKKRETAKAEVAYVLPDSLPVVDTTAVIRRVLMTYRSGDPVHIVARIGGWAKLALPGGGVGWVKQNDLIDAAAYDKGRRLIRDLASSHAQAEGHTSAPVNLRLGPSHDALKLGEYAAEQRVEVYGRRVVMRPSEAGGSSSASSRSVWYLVTGGGRAGWVLGRFVDLDVPAALASYAQGINMVAWLPLDTVSDGDRAVPQYLVADRIGGEEFDFNHIRVFTWWVKHHKYVTAYVESGMDGYFPIVVTHMGNVPYFHLHLMDTDGHQVQKVYGLFDTIVHPVGIVDGWTSNAMPAPSQPLRRRSKRRRRRAGLR